MSELSFGAQDTAEAVTSGLDLSGKCFVVTGCNSGLGHETCRVLALRGAQIIGLARTQEKAIEALDALGLGAQAVACELGDLASVDAAVATVRALGSIDGIIANAGVMALQDHQQIHGIEEQFFVNHVGHFRLVTGLLESLAEDGRVVMLSSGAHRMAPESGIELDDLAATQGYHPWTAYGQSKLANLLFARSLARRFEGSSRTANSVHPGVIDTNLGRHVPNKEAMYERLKAFMKTTPQGASTQCLVATHPGLAQVSGAYFSDNKVVDPIHPKALDDELAERLWLETEAIIARALNQADA